MKLQNLTVIFIIIIMPIILLVSLYITTGLKTIKYQSMYDEGLLNATHDAIYAFELNTAKNEYSDNVETKRNILKSSIKMFERSLANTCNISSYNTDEIEEYIPAIVFGMHDGFYMYAPSYLETTKKYEHNLKNYVYYSEKLDNKGTVIIYSLDNYVTVSGYFDGKYQIKEGYLIDLNGSTADGSKYKGIEIDSGDATAIKYYKEAYYFTVWFNENIGKKYDYLKINSKNDPENEDSKFVQHKREIIRNKIEDVLNSSITAYSKRTWGQNYKMPKLSEEDWEKIYSNISMITFFQGKNIGLTKYNGYCVLNSTNSNEYVNPNLMYFVDEDGNTYHDIRCTEEKNTLKGYKIGDFKKIISEKTDDEGNVTKNYEYRHKELACYECINGSLDTNKTVQEYISTTSDDIKSIYWTSLARERYNTPKQLDTACVITQNLTGLTTSNSTIIVQFGESFTTTITPTNSLTHRRPETITIIMNGKLLTGEYSYNSVNGEINIPNVTGNVEIIASNEVDTSNISFTNPNNISVGQNVTANIDQSYRVRVFKFIPTETATYRFWSNDTDSKTPDPDGEWSYKADPYAYLYDGEQYSIEQLDSLVATYISSQDAWTAFNNNSEISPLIYNDDGGEGYNFSMTYECEENHIYYLVIRTYTSDKIQEFSNILIDKVN